MPNICMTEADIRRKRSKGFISELTTELRGAAQVVIHILSTTNLTAIYNIIYHTQQQASKFRYYFNYSAKPVLSLPLTKDRH